MLPAGDSIILIIVGTIGSYIKVLCNHKINLLTIRRNPKDLGAALRSIGKMKLSWLVIAALLGLGVYLSLELLFGPYGLVAYHQLERFRERSLVEFEVLHRQTAELQRQVRMLTTDAETIRLEARDIGLVAANEVVVRLENRDPRPRHRYMPGTLPAQMKQVRDNRPLFRSLGLTVFLLSLLIPLAGIRLVPRGKRKEVEEPQDPSARHSR